MKITYITALIATLVFSQPCAAEPMPDGLERIEHIVVIYLENRSFDSLFGLFPGADGLSDAENAYPQLDEYGRVYRTLPPVKADSRFPANLANSPFNIGHYVPAEMTALHNCHRPAA